MKKNIQLGWVEALRTLVAISVSILIILIIVLIVSKEPLEAITSFLFGPFATVRRIGNIVELMIPLMFTGLATVVIFRVGLFNLSVEGGFFFGSVIAAAAAIALPFPPFFSLLAAMLLAALAGGVATAIPGILKVKCHANEIVTSLMLNYALLNIGLFVALLIRDTQMNSNFSYMFRDGIILPVIIPGTQINLGLVIAGVCTFLIYLLMQRTSFGLKARLVGKNSIFAKYSGIHVSRIILLSQIIGGLIAGLGGASVLFGSFRRFQYQDLPGYGWDGILIAIVARYQSQYVPLAAFFLAYLRSGASVMAQESDVPFEIVKVIQAIVIVLISAQVLLSGYRKKVLAREAKIYESKEVNKVE